jgi:hypothetical protein
VSAYPAKSLEIAQYIDGYKLDTGPVQNAQTGLTYTFLITDTTKTVTANNAAASAYTVPPQSSVVWEAYTVLRLVNLGAGVVTLTAGAGVTLSGSVTVPQYGAVQLMRTGSNAWTIMGTSASRTLIASASLSGATVSFTSIPSTYRNLRLYILNGRSSSNAEIRLTWTGSTNFRTVQARYVPGVATDVRGLNDGFGYLSIGGVTAAGTGLQAIANIFEANNAASRKVMHVVLGGELEGVGSAGNAVSYCSDATAAIATITLSPSAGSFNQGTAYLYGSD